MDMRRNRTSVRTKHKDKKPFLKNKRENISIKQRGIRGRIIGLYEDIGILSFVVKSFKRVLVFNEKEKAILRGTMTRKSNKELCKELGLSSQKLAHSRQEIVRKVEEVFTSSPHAFSATEEHILRGIAKGKTFDKIASEGKIKIGTLARLLRKLREEYRQMVSKTDRSPTKILDNRITSRLIKELLGEPFEENCMSSDLFGHFCSRRVCILMLVWVFIFRVKIILLPTFQGQSFLLLSPM